MIRKLEITKKKEIKMVEYWVIRGISDKNGRKEVIKEVAFEGLPTLDEIADFLLDNPKVDFVSVAHNFAREGEWV